jgi:hypothetical protein
VGSTGRPRHAAASRREVCTTLGTGIAVLAAVLAIAWALTRSVPSTRRTDGRAAPAVAMTPSASAPTTRPGAGADVPANPVPVSPRPTTTTPDLGPDVRVQIVLTPGSCRYDPDAQELQASGTIRGANGSGVVEVDVTWSDGTGELDSSSDIDEVEPGRSVPWEVSTGAFGPPQGALTCRATQG